MMMEEMIHMSENSKAGILVCLGFMREKMPWVYDIGIETLRTIDTCNDKKEMQKSLFEFQDIIKLSTRHPMMEEFMDTKEDYMMYEEFPRMIMHEMERYMERKLK